MGKKIAIVLASMIFIVSFVSVGIFVGVLTEPYELEISIGNETYKITEDKKNYELLEVSKSMEIEFSKRVSIKVNGQSIESGDFLSIDEISNDQYLTIEIDDIFNDFIVIFKILSDDFPKLSINGEYESEKDIYFTISSNEYVKNYYACKMSIDGEILYVKQNNHELLDFKRLDLEEGTFYTYAYLTYTNNPEIIESRTLQYNYVVLDENFNFVKTIERMPSVKYDYDGGFLDGHDIYFYSLDHYITVSYLPVSPENEDLPFDTVYTSYLQEVKDGIVVWEFLGSDYPEFYDFYDLDFLGRNPNNYMFINGFSIDENDGNIVASLRKQDAVIKISKGTGEVLWQLSGPNDSFNLDETEILSRQHHPTMISSDELLVFNNNKNIGNSSIDIYKLGENEILEHRFYEWDSTSNYCGSVMHESDDIFVIGYGVHNTHNLVMSITDLENSEHILTVESENPIGTYRVVLN